MLPVETGPFPEHLDENDDAAEMEAIRLELFSDAPSDEFSHWRRMVASAYRHIARQSSPETQSARIDAMLDHCLLS